jgi:hypothetical protein
MQCKKRKIIRFISKCKLAQYSLERKRVVFYLYIAVCLTSFLHQHQTVLYFTHVSKH